MEDSNNYCPKCSERQDIIGPETLMSELGDKFFEKSSASDWLTRKEALEKLQKVLQTSHLLKDGDYQPLLSHLRKTIITDLCVIVVALAVQCVTSLARGLGKQFGKYAEGMCQILFEKFVEKRQKMTELLREAVDTIFETTRFESLQTTITRLLKHHNPSVRYEIILFLARSFPKSNKRVLSKPQFQSLFLNLKSLLGDGDIFIREKTLAALGAAVQVAGEKAMLPYIRDLDLASKAKIEVYQMRAWETAKTYNEMKFPNFRETPRKSCLTEFPYNISTGSQVSISHKQEGSKSDVIGSVSIRSVNTISINSWASESEKQFLQETNNESQKCINIQPKNNISKITEDSKIELISSNQIEKELSLPARCHLHADGFISPADVPNPEHCHILPHPNIDAEADQSSKVDIKEKKDLYMLGESKKQLMIRQFTNQCMADVAYHLKEITKEHRLITYRQPAATETANEDHDQKAENITLPTVHEEPENEAEENHVGFTKKELDDLLSILNAAKVRIRAKENVSFKRKLYSRKHRYTTMSKGFLNKSDHKETQCTSAVTFDKPTQTLLTKEMKPNSISCIVNCCDKCTRLLLATAAPDSKYIFPVNASRENPQQQAEESSDNTVYRELVSSDRIQTKSESDLIKPSLDTALVSNEHEVNHNAKVSRSYETKNFITYQSVGVNDRSNKCQNTFGGMEAIIKPDITANSQQTDPVKHFSSKSRGKRNYSRNDKVAMCNKTTYVTTTSQRRRKKRKRNQTLYAKNSDLAEIPEENHRDWHAKDFYRAESKRAMKVRVIRIE